MTSEIVCDFCGGPNPKFLEESLDKGKLLDIKGMVQGEVVDTCWAGVSEDNAWASCVPCNRLIHDNQRETLVRRCARQQAERNPEIKQMIATGVMTWADMTATVARAQSMFWANRTGNYRLA
jgi:hypothetical protein